MSRLPPRRLGLGLLTPGVLEPVCTGGRYGVHSHITEGHAGAAIDDSADCSAEAGDDPAEAQSHLLFENLADRVELSVSS